MKEIKNAIIELLKVKSIITIMVMVVFTILALSGQMDGELIAFVISAIITYYFTKREKTDKM